jgi:glycerol-3-phosphate O-acyltransferase
MAFQDVTQDETSMHPQQRYTVNLRTPEASPNAALFRFNKERSAIVAEVCRRVHRSYVTDARSREDAGLEYVLNEAAYMESERMAHYHGPEEEIRPRAWWVGLSKRVATMSEQERRDVLRELIEAYGEDIASQFNPAVYKVATEVLPIGLGVLFKAQDLQDLPKMFPNIIDGLRQLRDLSDRVIFEGPLDTLRRLGQKGTLLFVPTHSSNMDSILVGYSLYQTGLPPVTYGAGKNLFSNPLTSFFMQNLGAYKVDRRIGHSLYKQILKTYSQVLLERGYHSLFFPGGTRCRSNIIEQRLKLGLLGTSITAYTRNLLQRDRDERIYICPLTINYNLVLEAESLIRDHLRREGGARYFLENDPFDQLNLILRFVMNTMRMESTTLLRFGEPMDPFGNTVEADGESYDGRGRRVDPTSYVRDAATGEVCHDDVRDREYTRLLGQEIASSFLRNTVIMPTQLVGYVLFALLQRRFPRWDLYRLLRLGGEEVIGWEELRQGVAALLEVLKNEEQAGRLRLSPLLRGGKPQRVAELGVEYLRMYHTPGAVDFHPDGVMLQRLELVHFYSNRLKAYKLKDAAWLERVKPG